MFQPTMMRFEVTKCQSEELETNTLLSTTVNSQNTNDNPVLFNAPTITTPSHISSNSNCSPSIYKETLRSISDTGHYPKRIESIEEDYEDNNEFGSSNKIQMFSDDDQNTFEEDAFMVKNKKQKKLKVPIKLNINSSNNLLNINDTYQNYRDSARHILLPATTIPKNKANLLSEIPYLPPLTFNTSDSSTGEIARQGRLMAHKSSSQSKRLVFKDGSCNVTTGNITERRKGYLVDIFTTLVDMKWRYNCLMFVSGFLGSWLFFAVIYYIVLLINGDHLNYMEKNWQPCFSNVYSFYTAFLFSLETQQTIGYGYRGMEAYCPYTIGVLMTQCCVGVFIQSLTAGIIFAKLSQPKRRAHTLLFSRKAVICSRDGEYCMLFRVGNMRKSHFVGTSIRAFIVQDKHTKEGECIPLWQNPLEIQAESCNDDDFVFLVWPVTIVHKINDKSPFWQISLHKLLDEHFEIIVVLEGVVESTGMTTQVRTSYLNTEILWGHRLAPLLTYQKENGQYKIDYSQFHAVILIQSMSNYSAMEHNSRKKKSEDDTVSKTTEMEAFNFGYISPETNTWKQEGWKLSMLKRMKGSMRFRGNKSFKKDLPNLNRRMSASTGALRALKSRHI